VITRWDHAVVEAVQHLHWGPLDWCFRQLSDQWIKGLLIVAIGLGADLLARRPPVAGGLAAIAFLLTGEITTRLKDVFDRPRPALRYADIHPLVPTPDNGSMPSGHASTAFAAAVAVGLVHPRLRWPVVALAALIAFSRIWLGVHYPTDVLVGAALGTAVAISLWLIVRPYVRR
jgi:undecaprenyl-diphosphatase